MGEIAELVKTSYEIFKGNEDVPITVENQSLGMAYAIPRGTEATIAGDYGPWQSAEVKQVFYQESSLLHSVLVEMQLIMSWRYSSTNQYIIEAYLQKNIISLDPTASVSITITFYQPNPMAGSSLEAFEISFFVQVFFRPVGDRSTANYKGVIRADGTGSLERA